MTQRAKSRFDGCSCDNSIVRCPLHGAERDEPPYTGDEPLGTCFIHGDYWTEDCTRCGR